MSERRYPVRLTEAEALALGLVPEVPRLRRARGADVEQPAALRVVRFAGALRQDRNARLVQRGRCHPRGPLAPRGEPVNGCPSLASPGISEPMSTVPAPCDLEAENEICALLLRGEATPERLLPLKPKHHFSRLHGLVHEAAIAVCSQARVVELDTIAFQLERSGLKGGFREDLREIRTFAPFLTESALERHKARLIELWGRRQMIATLQRTEIALRVGEIDCAGVRGRIEAQLLQVLA